MAAIRGPKRQEVVERAGGICEYCRLPWRMVAAAGPFVVDHIRPQTDFPEGSEDCDDVENLAFACWRCNGGKSDKQSGVLGGQEVPLFNPRTQEWRKHFTALPSGHIIGITPCGEVTVAELGMNSEPLAVTNRAVFHEQGWWPAFKSA